VENPVARDRLRRRAGTVLETLDNLETLYFANASLGTPAQKLRLHIDTGSSDLWANAKSSDLCQEQGNQCADSGTYDANSSTTYNYVNSDFNISYVDGSGASGDYVKDTLSFGGQNLKGMQFGIGYTSTSPEGILGIGYTVNEVQVNRAGGQAYPNLPQLLADNKIINSNAYSLWLNDLEASTGSILFGGVDTEKYTGSLQTLPVIAEQGVFAEFIIALTGMGVNGKAGSLFDNETVPVLLDSGSSLMYLPDDLVTSLYTQFNAQYDSSQGAAFVDCSLANDATTLDFTFSSPTISVPMNELVIVAGYQRGQPVCILGKRAPSKPHFPNPPTPKQTPNIQQASAPPVNRPACSATPSCAPPTSSTTCRTTRSRSRRPTSTQPSPTSWGSRAAPRACRTPRASPTPSAPSPSAPAAPATAASPTSRGPAPRSLHKRGRRLRLRRRRRGRAPRWRRARGCCLRYREMGKGEGGAGLRDFCTL